nr:MAG TPA: hypothetical protein [Caudoviricetes sp.]
MTQMNRQFMHQRRQKIVTMRIGIDGHGYIMIYAYSFKRVN